MRKLLPALCLLAFLCTGAPAQSAAPQTALPIEIKMLYLKLLNREPDYDTIIRENPAYIADPRRFDNPVIMEQQRAMLKNLYNKSGKSQRLQVYKTIGYDYPDSDARTITTRPIPITDPVIFRVSPTDVYAVFIRNPKDLETLAPPFEYDNFVWLKTAFNNEMNTLLTLQPLAADPEDVTLPSGETVHVVLAKVVRLSLDDPTGDRLLLDKKFEGNQGLPVPALQNPASPGQSLPPATVTPSAPTPPAPVAPSAEDDLPLPPAAQ